MQKKTDVTASPFVMGGNMLIAHIKDDPDRINVVPSLLQLCTECLVKNLESITEFGDVPDELILPILRKATREQIEHIEASTTRALPTGEIWQKACQKEFSLSYPKHVKMMEGTIYEGDWKRVYKACKNSLRKVGEKAKAEYEEIEKNKKRSMMLTGPLPPQKTGSQRFNFAGGPSGGRSGGGYSAPKSMLQKVKMDVRKNPPLTSKITTKANPGPPVFKRPSDGIHNTVTPLLRRNPQPSRR